ncbi:arginine methyltransferase 4-PA [Capsaspora owczarzaki ATCC 30864]|uniref:type I protein arginine methyltransferase n=1 Tax=Capsaspora owczarzaki (strain ATCC 30864) TaxID=595528 RepID=A0A0D2WIF9_CAPO3|nr:arginine methyltransferase 4-PA [Capsaspora owczarzaki ATCC 30864]KJE88813.1 arginine methyltransferase 4-PA [Capsaspora owczarzaki ATCC 30864]|eukprot:XP_004365265.1 arginine methyltransferase 4-PA [Capsaspora owczarzaki ATCC 30864]
MAASAGSSSAQSQPQATASTTTTSGPSGPSGPSVLFNQVVLLNLDDDSKQDAWPHAAQPISFSPVSVQSASFFTLRLTLLAAQAPLATETVSKQATTSRALPAPRVVRLQIVHGDGTILDSIMSPYTQRCKLSARSCVLGLAERAVSVRFATVADYAQFDEYLLEHLATARDSDCAVAPVNPATATAATAATAVTSASENAPSLNGTEAALSEFAMRTDRTSSSQYFHYYGQLLQQQNMLQDLVRTGTYQRAMLENAADFEDKVVLDVGAGTGVLSFFAIQAGARKVYAIEASAMADNTRLLVERNGLAGRIIVINAKAEEVELPEQVDLIISEPMGTLLVNERMLETYIYARKWLRHNPDLPAGQSGDGLAGDAKSLPMSTSTHTLNDGDGDDANDDATAANADTQAPAASSTHPSAMFPSMAYLYCAPFVDEYLYMEQFSKTTFWYQPSFYGINVSDLHERALQEVFSQPIVDAIDPALINAKPVCKIFNFGSVATEELVNFEIPFSFKYETASMVHGLAFWFDVSFNGSQSVVWLSTSPVAPLTHWYQFRCLMPRPVLLARGQTLVGRAIMRGNSRQSYDLEVEMSILEMPNVVLRNRVNVKEPLYRYTGSPVAATTQAAVAASTAAAEATAAAAAAAAAAGNASSHPPASIVGDDGRFMDLSEDDDVPAAAAAP